MYTLVDLSHLDGNGTQQSSSGYIIDGCIFILKSRGLLLLSYDVLLEASS